MAKFITPPSRRVPVVGEYDIVVAGGGPAGVASAVAAGRKGAKVLLLEQTGCLGGLGTAGLVPCFCPFSWENAPDKGSAVGGLALEVMDRLRAAGGTDGSSWPSIDAERLKLVYDEMTTGAKVKVLFFTFVSDVMLRGRKLQAVLIQNKAGRQAVTGRFFIDATGDADLAARAGVKFEQGDERGRTQGTTLCFTVAGVDTQTYFGHLRMTFRSNAAVTAWLHECQAQGKLPAVPGAEYRLIAHKQINPGTVGYNMGHVFGIDGTNPEDLSAGMRKGRQLAHHFVDFARQHIPGMANAHIVATGSLLGVRETRRIHGLARLELDDFRASRHGGDDIAQYDYPIDVHPASAGRKETQRTDRQMETLVQSNGATYGIPLGILVPQGVDNLLVAGKSISADRMMQGSLRVMPSCLAMGQAAGTAAALCVTKKTTPAKLDIQALRKMLKRDGARIQE